MGVDYYAVGILGCEIPPGRLYAKRLVRGCKCPTLPPYGANFCPRCGSRAEVEAQCPAPEYDERNDAFAELHVVYTTDRKQVLVGVLPARVSDDKDAALIPADVVEAVRKRVRAALEPLGLYNEARFGFWVGLYCSY